MLGKWLREKEYERGLTGKPFLSCGKGSIVNGPYKIPPQATPALDHMSLKRTKRPLTLLSAGKKIEFRLYAEENADYITYIAYKGNVIIIYYRLAINREYSTFLVANWYDASFAAVAKFKELLSIGNEIATNYLYKDIYSVYGGFLSE